MHVFECTTSNAFPVIVKTLSEKDAQHSRNGDTRERLGVAIQSQDPRERLFFRENYNLAFQLQEAIAYWAGQNPGHVERYNSTMTQFMTDGELKGSAYGRYLRRVPHDQIDRVVQQLVDNQTTRRAVIAFHQPHVENYDGPDVACTLTMQLVIRDDSLHAFTSMRSQDMYWGYPYDVHNFQWLQEVLAGILGVELGSYTHYMNNCHYYVEREPMVLDAARDMDPVSLPDIRLPRDELDAVMFYLTHGLARARDGLVPWSEIDALHAYEAFYADWLRYMTAYEQRRFHDNEETAIDIANDIAFTAFKDQV
jgi:thymidylate synthase